MSKNIDKQILCFRYSYSITSTSANARIEEENAGSFSHALAKTDFSPHDNDDEVCSVISSASNCFFLWWILVFIYNDPLTTEIFSALNYVSDNMFSRLARSSHENARNVHNKANGEIIISKICEFWALFEKSFVYLHECIWYEIDFFVVNLCGF